MEKGFGQFSYTAIKDHNGFNQQVNKGGECIYLPRTILLHIHPWLFHYSIIFMTFAKPTATASFYLLT